MSVRGISGVAFSIRQIEGQKTLEVGSVGCFFIRLPLEFLPDSGPLKVGGLNGQSFSIIDSACRKIFFAFSQLNLVLVLEMD